MRTLRKIAFLLEDFTTPPPSFSLATSLAGAPPPSVSSPSQQLLDRFLIGYPRDGQFHRPTVSEVSAYLMLTDESDFGRRTIDFGLKIAPTAEQAAADADAVIIASRKPGSMANDRLLEIALERASQGSACFVHGALSSSLERGRTLLRLAESRGIHLLAGTPWGVTWRLPETDLPAATPLAEALIVVQRHSSGSGGSQGSLPGAELDALEGLLPIIERRQGGESGVRSLRLLEGPEVWRAGDKKLWSWKLLAAALSRSNSPQGDPVLDGRTQDILGLGLVPKLARNPVAWLLEHRDGLRSALLVLDGVVADHNFALGTRDGRVLSAQLFRAPPPADHHFSRLVAVLEDFFQTGRPPWPVQRNLLIAGLLETFRHPASHSGKTIATPGLDLAYAI